MGAESPKDECGLFGVWAPGEDVARLTYFGLFAQQHRGQESAGIAVSDGHNILIYKDLGLVAQVFNEATLTTLQGDLAVGHTRYSTTGSTTWDNAQPVFKNDGVRALALGHNGNLVNTQELVSRLGRSSAATTDSDLVATMLASEMAHHDLEGAAMRVLPELEGAFCFVMADERSVFAARDPHGLRPLAVGKLPKGFVVASETCALDIVGAAYIREVEPGELVRIDDRGLHSARFARSPRAALCIFEFVYLSRADSRMKGVSVHEARREMGRLLAAEHPVEADLVIAVPNTGHSAAQGFSEVSGIPYGDGLHKNQYVGRTFIQPSQSLRERGVKLKLNPLPDTIRGKRLIVVDDSIVRGTTTRQIVSMLREAGATEVHIRITAPADPLAMLLRDRHEHARGARRGRSRRRRDPRVRGRRLPRLPLARGAGPSDRGAGRGLLSRLLRRRVPDPGPRARRQVRAGGSAPAPDGVSPAYRDAGVDTEAAAKAVALIADLAASVRRPEVADQVGGFAGLYRIGEGRLLAAATDGVGTKLEIARQTGRLNTVGIDLVAMCADDVACTGAEPLFFLDYLAVGRVEPTRVASIVEGVVEGCRRAGCALLGGETAEHPGVMEDDVFDLAGFCVGIVDEAALLGPHRVAEGDIVVGLASSGLHANGYSLVRSALLQRFDLDHTPPGLDRPLADELLEPCAIYAPEVVSLARDGLLHAAAHVTGGGMFENLPAGPPGWPRGHDPPGHLARAPDLRSRSRRRRGPPTTTCSRRSTWASAWPWSWRPRRSRTCSLAAATGHPGSARSRARPASD